MSCFSVNDINVANLSKLVVEDVSVGIGQGRRFKIISLENQTSSDPLVFGDIFKKVKKTVKPVIDDQDTLFIARQLLVDLKKVDHDAKEASSARAENDIWYKIRTCIHRFFSRTKGSYAKDLNKLIAQTDDKLVLLANSLGNDLDKKSFAIKFIEAGKMDEAVSVLSSIEKIEVKKTFLGDFIQPGETFDSALLEFSKTLPEKSRVDIAKRLIDAQHFDEAFELSNTVTLFGLAQFLSIQFKNANQQDKSNEMKRKALELKAANQ